MELSERIIRQFEQEGFANVYEWQDKADATYPAHTHQGKVSLFVTDGSLTVDFGEETKEVNQNERLDIPPGNPHTIKVGQQGWIGIIAEEIPGDTING